MSYLEVMTREGCPHLFTVVTLHFRILRAEGFCTTKSSWTKVYLYLKTQNNFVLNLKKKPIFIDFFILVSIIPIIFVTVKRRWRECHALPWMTWVIILKRNRQHRATLQSFWIFLPLTSAGPSSLPPVTRQEGRGTMLLSGESKAHSRTGISSKSRWGWAALLGENQLSLSCEPQV